MFFYGVVDSRLPSGDTLVGDVIELFVRREDAEAMVKTWDVDKPEDAAAAGALQPTYRKA